MILWVDVESGSRSVSLSSESPATLTVVVRGRAERCEVDLALREVGAGCVPDHHAELNLAWLLERAADSVGVEEDESPNHTEAKWLRSDRLDDSGKWIAAPITWTPLPPGAGMRRGIRWPANSGPSCPT